MTLLKAGQPGLDERLPQLEAALDAELMRAALQQRLCDAVHLHGRYNIEAMQLNQVRYKPQRKCLISWRLVIADPLRGEPSEQFVSTQIFPAGESRSRYLKACAEPVLPVGCGRPLLHLPELEMIVRVFPNDRKLRHLALLNDAEALKKSVVPPLTISSVGRAMKLDRLRHRLVHYVPEHTCTVRLEAELCDDRTGATTPQTWYGKTYDTDEGAVTWRQMQRLWQRAARRDGRWLMAQPLLYQPENRTLWQRGLPGAPLPALQVSSRRFISLLTRAAEAVAWLHQSSLPDLPTVTVTELNRRLDETARLITHLRPDAAESPGRLVERLKGGAGKLQARPRSVLHGDLHWQNFLASGDQVALIDLDNLCAGDALQDVGSFIAGLYYRGLLEGIPTRMTRLIADEFVQAYRAAAGAEFPAADLAWHIAAALIYERAARCVTRLKDGRLALIDDLLALAASFGTRPQ